MERLTERTVAGTANLSYPSGCYYADGEKDQIAVSAYRQKAIDRLADYEEFMERWRLRSLEEAGRIFQRVNALGGTDLMAQYRDLGPIDHLRELAQAEKDGRLAVLPCKVGDTVYVTYGEGYRACVVDCVYILANNRVQVRMRHSCTETLWLSDAFGKTVFLTREEAEAALKKREEAGAT